MNMYDLKVKGDRNYITGCNKIFCACMVCDKAIHTKMYCEGFLKYMDFKFAIKLIRSPNLDGM